MHRKVRTRESQITLNPLIGSLSPAVYSPQLVHFLTMLVGSGGNAGNQAAVLVIRALATGSLTRAKEASYLKSEARMALGIGILVLCAGVVRVLVFQYTMTDAATIGLSLLSIVIVAVIVGAVLPLLFVRLRLDPAHAGATVQVVMDLLGVLITCQVAQAIMPVPASTRRGEGAELPGTNGCA